MNLGEWTNLCSILCILCSMILLYLVLQKDSNALLDSEDDLLVCDFIIILVSS